MKQLKLASANQGYKLRRRINRLETNLQSFIVHLCHRIQLQPQNTAFLLQAQTNCLRQSLLQLEPSRLKSSNKIHNFTTYELPADFINLLNKGTTFISTQDNCNINSCKKTITEQVNAALFQTIRKSSSATSLIHEEPRHKESIRLTIRKTLSSYSTNTTLNPIPIFMLSTVLLIPLFILRNI